MAKSLNVALLVDEAWVPPDDPQFQDGSGPAQTERDVAAALRRLGHRVRVIAVGSDLPALVAGLAEDTPDLAFSLVEQFDGDRRGAIHVTGLLELMQIPFTGAGPTAMLLCHDKAVCKQLLGLRRIDSPRFVRLPPGRPVRLPRWLGFPLVVKPQFEEGSEGIAKASLVRSGAELARRVGIIHRRMRMAAMAEEFVAGRELYVAVLGNASAVNSGPNRGRLTVLPPRELVFGRSGEGGPAIATFTVKHDDDYRRKWRIDYVLAELDGGLARRIDRLARDVYRTLGLAGYARIDLRLRPDGRISVLEVNANPDLASDEDLAESAAKAHLPYDALIARIVHLGLKR